MKRSIIYTALVFGIFGTGLLNPAWAGTVSGSGWTALTNEGPALTSYVGANYFVAWKGFSGNKIWYSYEGQQQAVVPGLLSTLGPAAATTVSTSFTVYLAARGQSTASTDNIYYNTWNGSSFQANATRVCAGATCPLTSASPALAASGSTLYLAWTTSSHTIEYATYNGSSWTILGTIPSTSTTTKPALAVYDGGLYLAWAESGNVYTSYNTSPLCATCWSAPLLVTGAQTTVSPALGVSTVPNHSGLFVAWTAGNTVAGYGVDFASWDGSGWLPWTPPIPIPPGPMANLSPALVGLGFIDIGGCEPVESFSFNLAFTLEGSQNGQIEFSPVSNGEIIDTHCKQ